MPKEIRQAYEKGTRGMDGKPGLKYWQNTADYKLEVKVEPATRRIDGKGTAVYNNQSPDDLNTLVVRLYYDVFRKANPRAERVDPEDIGEGVELKKLVLNGKSLEIGGREVQRYGTNLFIRLAEPLKAGQKATLDCEWTQYVPLTNERTGVADSTSFFIAYWYPQFAVYDDVFGWDTQDYSLRTEFYNNLGNFDVKITVPKSFSVWATGVLQNAQEIYPKAVFDRYQKALKSTETVQILQASDLKVGYANLSETWHFKAEEVSDFAFAMSDHYLWDAATQKVDNREVLVSSVYPQADAENYQELTAIQQQIMKHFSEDVPGIPYPYPRFTTFIGLQGGGMEFPMMAYNQNEDEGLTAHEMYHSYFPMYVRINERRFAWMDEGWADYITDIVMKRYLAKDPEPLFGAYKTSIQEMMGSYEDLPLITSSQFMDDSNYGYASYPLPAFVYSMLHHHLGDDLFKKAYQEYIRRWAKKSPTPYDFFYTFENVSKQDLSWLWKPWFFEQGYADIQIKGFQGGQLTIQNKGNRPVPVYVEIAYKDGKEDKILASAATWQKGAEQKITIPNAAQVKSLSVNGNVADLNEMDNFYPSLKEQVKEFTILDGIYGVYLIQGYNIEMTVMQKEGLPFLKLPAAGMESYLMPKADGSYTTLDKMLLIEFKEESGKITGLKAQLRQYGIEIQGTKK
ncbi:MAG: M1 family metallopeptidase [Microscillaceae bacterium]|nr:M1 family metallopeptidase [Microscillaceae bacterium]